MSVKRYPFRYLAHIGNEVIAEGELSTPKIAKLWMIIEAAIEKYTQPGDTISCTVTKVEGPGRGSFDRVYNNVKGKARRAR